MIRWCIHILYRDSWLSTRDGDSSDSFTFHIGSLNHQTNYFPHSLWMFGLHSSIFHKHTHSVRIAHLVKFHISSPNNTHHWIEAAKLQPCTHLFRDKWFWSSIDMDNGIEFSWFISCEALCKCHSMSHTDASIRSQPFSVSVNQLKIGPFQQIYWTKKGFIRKEWHNQWVLAKPKTAFNEPKQK